MAIKLIATDIDDTLLNSKRQLTPRTIQTLKAATAQGVKVVLCTGRPLQAVKPLLAQLGLAGPDQYAITFNGAMTVQLDGTVLNRLGLGRADFQALAAFAEAHQAHYNLRDEAGAVLTPNEAISFYTVRQAYDSGVGVTRAYPDQVPADFRYIKGMLCEPPTRLDAIEAAARATFSQDYYVVRSTPFFLEVMNPAANKGNGLKALAQQLGLTPAEVMACGDERNDLPMLRWAGAAVAVANGIPEVKRTARYLTADNDHDGVARAIEQYVLA